MEATIFFSYKELADLPENVHDEKVHWEFWIFRSKSSIVVTRHSVANLTENLAEDLSDKIHLEKNYWKSSLQLELNLQQQPSLFWSLMPNQCGHQDFLCWMGDLWNELQSHSIDSRNYPSPKSKVGYERKSIQQVSFKTTTFVWQIFCQICLSWKPRLMRQQAKNPY